MGDGEGVAVAFVSADLGVGHGQLVADFGAVDPDTVGLVGLDWFEPDPELLRHVAARIGGEPVDPPLPQRSAECPVVVFAVEVVHRGVDEEQDVQVGVPAVAAVGDLHRLDGADQAEVGFEVDPLAAGGDVRPPAGQDAPQVGQGFGAVVAHGEGAEQHPAAGGQVGGDGLGDVAGSFGSDLVRARQARPGAPAGHEPGGVHVAVDGAFEHDPGSAADCSAALDDPACWFEVTAGGGDEELGEIG